MDERNNKLADAKITQLTELTTPADGDLLAIVDDPSGSPITKKITKANFLAGAGSATKEFFIQPVFGNGTISGTGNYGLRNIGNSAYVYFNFYIPNDFTSLTEAVVVVIPDATETIQWDLDMSYTAAGETHTANGSADSNKTASATINQILECDLNQGNFASSAASFAAGDYIGIKFTSNTDILQVAGLRFKYS